MQGDFKAYLQGQLEEIRSNGLHKAERIISTPQGSALGLGAGGRVINMCANNYLGLANHPEVVAAAQEALGRWGYGMASVRFICGTLEIHKQLEAKLAAFLGTEDCILYSSCFDAKGGLFETLLGPEDAIISDALNHASIIDGVRLCKAQRLRYNNCDLADLEAKLAEAKNCRFKLVATDGVFSMDGSIAPLDKICDLADKHGALVMFDDSHAVGFLGAKGRGTHEFRGCVGRPDIITGTLGKALGGASGGYTAGGKEVVEMLRQRSRPYLFSNTVPPPIVAATLKALELVERDDALRGKLSRNAAYFRKLMTANGFDLKPGEHPIIPVMLGDAVVAQRMAAKLLEEGVYAVGFFYPVVPKGQARIRTQVSAAHSLEDLDKAAAAFVKARAAVA